MVHERFSRRASSGSTSGSGSPRSSSQSRAPRAPTASLSGSRGRRESQCFEELRAARPLSRRGSARGALVGFRRATTRAPSGRGRWRRSRFAAKPLAQGEPAAARPLAAKPRPRRTGGGTGDSPPSLSTESRERRAGRSDWLAKPAPLEVEWDADGAPARLRGRGESWQRVVAAAGPRAHRDRLVGRGRVARAYFEVRRENGEEWWVYRDLATGRGYVHGLFG